MRIETRRIVISEEEHGLRLDVYLTRRFGNFSRNEWQQRIAENAIAINGNTARASRRIQAGDILVFSYSMRDEPEVPTNIEIVLEDANFLIINKPPGLPVHPSGIYKTQTVTTLLKERGILHEGYLLHRLDRETSGVLALAKNRNAAARFQKVLRSGKIEKSYLVIVEGVIEQPISARGVIYRMPGSRLPRKRYFSLTKEPEGAIEPQTSFTEFSPIAHHAGLTLLKARLHTGRMHQIRATLSGLGHPVVGDKLYGADENFYFKFADNELTPEDWQRLRLSRSGLHCAEMLLEHPLTGEPWALKAPLPEDMRTLIFPN
ncbi:MAG: RluA family pseudouridine synthase [Leptospiraceae bacterium]|nr:RluA family pseudouridine synthase [Leptospiraceae bacterium]